MSGTARRLPGDLVSVMCIAGGTRIHGIAGIARHGRRRGPTIGRGGVPGMRLSFGTGISVRAGAMWVACMSGGIAAACRGTGTAWRNRSVRWARPSGNRKASSLGTVANAVFMMAAGATSVGAGTMPYRVRRECGAPRRSARACRQPTPRPPRHSSRRDVRRMRLPGRAASGALLLRRERTCAARFPKHRNTGISARRCTQYRAPGTTRAIPWSDRDPPFSRIGRYHACSRCPACPRGRMDRSNAPLRGRSRAYTTRQQHESSGPQCLSPGRSQGRRSPIRAGYSSIPPGMPDSAAGLTADRIAATNQSLRSRNSRRMIFPVVVIGRAST